MNFFEYSSIRPSTRCSSRPVPSVTVIRACVSPRWNTAEPCTRGSTSTWHSIGRSVLLSRPSGRVPARIRSRTTFSSSACQAWAKRVGGDRALGRRIGNQLGHDAGLQSRRRRRPGPACPRSAWRLAKRVVVAALEPVEQAVVGRNLVLRLLTTLDLGDQLDLQIADLP